MVVSLRDRLTLTGHWPLQIRVRQSDPDGASRGSSKLMTFGVVKDQPEASSQTSCWRATEQTVGFRRYRWRSGCCNRATSACLPVWSSGCSQRSFLTTGMEQTALIRKWRMNLWTSARRLALPLHRVASFYAPQTSSDLNKKWITQAYIRLKRIWSRNTTVDLWCCKVY